MSNDNNHGKVEPYGVTDRDVSDKLGPGRDS